MSPFDWHLTDSFHLDTLLAGIPFWGGSRIVKNPTQGNIARMNLGLFALAFFVWLRPLVATSAVWAAVVADALFIFFLTQIRDRPPPRAEEQEKAAPPLRHDALPPPKKKAPSVAPFFHHSASCAINRWTDITQS